MEDHFFSGFMDELMKVAGGAKAQYDASGKFIGFKSAYTPPKVQEMPPPPEFKPGSGYKPKGNATGLIGGKTKGIQELKREGVFFGGKRKPAAGKAREIKLPSGAEENMAREMKLPPR